MSSVKRVGRRPGKPETREQILQAAGKQFAEVGYDRASMRSIAAEAAVDPALVIHYFESKQKLFIASVGLPLDPVAIAEAIAGGRRDRAGERLAQLLVDAIEDPATRRRLVGVVRAAASEPAAAEMIRGLIGRELAEQVVDRLHVSEPKLRVNLVGSQIVGLVMACLVVGVEPLASLPPERLVGAVAPTLQRYLTGELG